MSLFLSKDFLISKYKSFVSSDVAIISLFLSIIFPRLALISIVFDIFFFFSLCECFTKLNEIKVINEMVRTEKKRLAFFAKLTDWIFSSFYIFVRFKLSDDDKSSSDDDDDDYPHAHRMSKTNSQFQNRAKSKSIS